MIISSRNDLAGHRIVQEFGLVRGSTIRARHLGRDILAGLKSIVGGEIQEYTKMMAEAREQAIDRMAKEASDAGGNAVLCVRFSTAYVMGGTAEIVVYGTAVKVEKS
ncbi:YbjQ family protein [Candidatus Palauibacter sp.]|uniref:YbjQ family protein n=1 Tax=Candidatus Palauibacter sp. TaxID=3101350 RepID=UPI003AF21F2E